MLVHGVQNALSLAAAVSQGATVTLGVGGVAILVEVLALDLCMGTMTEGSCKYGLVGLKHAGDDVLGKRRPK
ncbi:hypothetical protein N7486_001787 [Penicillium sp. IBT 16267x]|nr:hypothetical protein N7486_001787 [Penicillium sp. IBT 16267x]